MEWAQTNHWAANMRRVLGRRAARTQHRLTKVILETLESRTLLSTYAVNTLADDGSSGSGLAGPLR